MASYQSRKSLRRSLLEKEFGDEYSLNPTQERTSKDFGPTTYGMLDTVTRKTQASEARHSALQNARVKTASLDPDKLLKEAFETSSMEVVEEEYLKIVERYRAGDHVLRNIAKEQMDDPELEAKMYATAAEIVRTSQPMVDNFDTYHIGDVALPPPTREHTDALNMRTRYIKFMSDRLTLHQKFLDMRFRVYELNESINDKEANIGSLTVDIEKNTKDDHFDWLLDMHTRIRSLKAQVEVDREDLEFAEKQLADTAEEMRQRYPDMTAAMSLGVLEEQEPPPIRGADHNALATESGVDIALLNEKRRNASGEEIGMVYGWVLGRLSSSGDLTHLLFGKFTQSPNPPEDGWVFIGKCIRLDDYVAAAREDMSISGEVQEHVEHGDTLSEVTLKCCQLDNISSTVTFSKVLLAVPGQQQKVETDVLTLSVNGCCLSEVNGRYLENGSTCNARKFSNVNGWHIFRHSLQEIPELDILASNCYDTLASGKGESISERMYKKTDIVTEELIRSDSRIEEGSAGFKRRFAELSRTGNRMITVDHQSDIIRKENLKASARMQSSEELLLTIGAAAADTCRIQLGNEENGDEDTAKELNTFTVAGPSDSHLRSKSSPSVLTVATGEYGLGRTKGKRGAESTKSVATTTNMINSYDSLDFTVMMKKNVQHQVGLQSYHNIHRKIKASVEEEGELSRAAFAAVEKREGCLQALRHEATDVQRRYEQSEELSEVVDKEKAMFRLMELVGDVRLATIEAAEAIGAWARVAALLLEKEKPKKHYLESKDASKTSRQYAVAVSRKGSQLYPPSKPLVESSNRRIRRGLEPAAQAVNVEYVGLYAEKDEAIKAFLEAASAIPMEQRYAAYIDDAPKMYIGLRSCGNHYLVRCDGVEPDHPCEQCGADRATNPQSYIPRATKDVFPQFLWHGENYLDKMWNDMKFLDRVDMLTPMKDKFDVAGNPLLLSRHRLSYVLSDIVRVNDGRTKKLLGIRSDVDLSALNELKAKIEQTRLAKEEAAKLTVEPKKDQLSGIAYTMAGTLPNLDAEYLNPSHTVTMERNGWSVYAAELKRTLRRIENMGGRDDQSVASTVSGVTAASTLGYSSVGEKSVQSHSSGSRESSLPPKRLPPLIPDSGKDFASTFGYDSGISKLQRDGLMSMIERTTDCCSEERVKRAMVILGQSLAVRKDFLRSVSVPEHETAESPPPSTGKVAKSRPRSAGKTRRRASDKEDPLISKTMSTAMGKKERKKKELQVMTQYGYLGATVATVQTRAPVAHRVENVWCRSDVGEWAGLTTKGRAMKKYENQERFVNEAKRKIEERAELQRMLRAAVHVDFVSCDVTSMKDLLQKSAKFSGSALDLDILKAEQYLSSRKLAISSVMKMQRVARGYNTRNALWIANTAKRNAHKRMMVTEEQAALLCTTLVPEIINTGLAKQSRAQAHAQFVMSANLGGVPMLVSVYVCARGLRKSENLCDSCLTKSFVRRYNPLKHQYYTDRAPCTCVLVQTREKWSIDFYDPISSTRFVREVEADEFRSRVEMAYAISKKLPVDHIRSLFGQDFGKIAPLMGQHKDSTPTEFCEARLAASKEYSVVAIMPRNYSANMMSSMKHLRLPAEIADVFARHRLPTTKNPIIVNDINDADFFIPNDAADTTSWEPLKYYIYCRYQGRVIELVLPVMQEYAEVTMRTYLEKKKEVYQHLINEYERACMDYEDMRSMLVETTDKYNIARQTVLDVMKFSRDGLQKFEAEERGEKEDWAQAWEDKEDASRWIGLNNVSKLRVLVKKHQELFAKKVKETQVVLDRHTKLLAEEVYCKRMAENDSSVIENYKMYIEAVRRAVATAREIAFEAVTAVVSGMSLHTTLALESSRRVRFPAYKLAYIREEARRVQVEYRSGWNMIARKVRVLRPHPGFNVHIPGRKCRCIVTVYRDPVTKNYILTVDSDDDHSISTEESSMNSDFGYPSDFYSPISKFSRPNEIAFAEKDFTLIFDKDHAWPENVRERPFVTEEPVIIVSNALAESKSVLAAAEVADPNKQKSLGEHRRPRSANASPVSPVHAQRLTDRPSTAAALPVKWLADPTKERHFRLTRKSNRPGSPAKDGHPNSAKRLPPLEVVPVTSRPSEASEEVKHPSASTPIVAASAAVPIAPSGGLDMLSPLNVEGITSPITTSVTIIQYNPHRMKYCPPGSYHQRRQQLKKDTAYMIRRVMKYLRLHPHSLRPMLGLLHFQRRINQFREGFSQSLWMRDLRRQFPHSWTNDFCHDKLSVISRRPLIAKMRDSWGDIVVKVRTPFGGRENGGFEAEMVVPFEKIVKSLIKTPILLATLLCETVTNKYSLDTIRSILNSIDLQLPGEEKRWWRRTFAKEKTPAVRFVESDEEKYRGVVYACHRFVSRRYCSVKVFKSCQLDLRIILGAPTDGMFPVQALNADADVIITLSADALKAFLLKKWKSRRTHTEKQNILNLWHPNFFHELICCILDNVHIGSKVMLKRYAKYDDNGEINDDDSSIASSLPELNEQDEFLLDNDEEPAEAPAVMTTWRQKLKVQLYRTIEMFNMWIKHHNYRITPIDKNIASDIFTALREYEVPPQWNIVDGANRDNNGADKIFVYDGFWPAVDPRRVMRRSFRLMDSYMSLSQVIPPGRDDVMQLPLETSTVSHESIFVEDSYWRVIVSTDQEKTAVEVDLHGTSMTDPSTQSEVSVFEVEAMALEDINSRNAARLELELAMLRDEGMVRFKTPPIPSRYASMIAIAKEKNEVMKAQLRRTQSKIIVAMDALMDKAALCSYKIGVDALDFKETESRGKQFVVDESTAEDLGHVRKGKKPPLSVFVNNRYSIEFRNVESNYTSDARAQESHVLCVAASKWLQKLELELINAECVSVPSRLYQANGVKVQAYPGLEPSYPADRDVHGRTSALGVGNVRSSRDPDENRSFYRNGLSFERIRPSRAWEVGPLQVLHPGFLEKAQKGTRPRIVKYDGDIYMMSSPSVGPFDIASVHIYSPRTRERFVVCFHSNLKLPMIGGMGRLAQQTEESTKLPPTVKEEERHSSREYSDDESGTGVAESEGAWVDDEDGGEVEYKSLRSDSTEIAMAKICARRVVWRSMINGITSATVRVVEGLIDSSLVRLERQVAYECNKWFPQVAYRKPKSKGISPVCESDEDSVSSDVQLPPRQQERLALLKKFAPTLLNKNLSSIRKVSEGSIDLSHYANVKLCAVYVPANEDITPTIFDSTASFEWQAQCYELLGCNLSDPPIRVTTMPGLLYFAPSRAVEYFATGADLNDGQLHNLRLSRFIYEYISNNGWRKGLAYIRHKNILARERTHDDFVEAPHVIGNTVILFRHGEGDMHTFMKWCKDRYDLRQEQLERRRLKEVADNRRRRQNYADWKRGVSGLANSYWPQMLRYFALQSLGYNFNASVGDNDIALHMCIERLSGSQLRTLLSYHSTQIRAEGGRQRMFEELCMMDSKSVFEDSSKYMRYATYKAEEFSKGDWYLSFRWNTNRHPDSIQPTAVQIIYALYLNHCSVCTLAAGTCRIPGCGIIRTTCGYCADGPDAFSPADDDLGGAGDHPLELSIKQYLLEYCDFSKTIVPHTLVAENTDVVFEEPSHGDESTINPPVVASAAEQNVVWREVEAKALNFRYINRRILHPSVSSYVSAEDVLDAKGGHDNREEKGMPYELTSGLTIYLPPVGGVSIERADTYNFHDEQSSYKSVEASLRSLVSTAGIKIPTTLLHKMLGVSHSSGDAVVARNLYDPCPPCSLDNCGDGLERVNSMSSELYSWIIQHVSIMRNPVPHMSMLLDNGSDGAGSVDRHPQTLLDMFESEEREDDPFALQFDRLHNEALAHAKDGTPIIVQVLHGILKHAMRSAGVTSGCPEAARRFLVGDILPQLEENGLTVHVYDLTSNVSKVILLEKRLLLSFSNQYHVPASNFPEVAKCIVKHSSEVIAVHRMDGICVDVTLSLAGVAREKPPLTTEVIFRPREKHISRRYTATNKQGMRVLAAAALLKVFSSEDDR